MKSNQQCSFVIGVTALAVLSVVLLDVAVVKAAPAEPALLFASLDTTGCEWVGTSPACIGGCRGGLVEILSANSKPDGWKSKKPKFGRPCGVGSKSLCCPPSALKSSDSSTNISSSSPATAAPEVAPVPANVTAVDAKSSAGDFSAANCVWVGTSPFCRGEKCEDGLHEVIHAKSDPSSTLKKPYPEFGATCITGEKVLCCPNAEQSASLKAFVNDAVKDIGDKLKQLQQSVG